jgi:hypothetical protein
LGGLAIITLIAFSLPGGYFFVALVALWAWLILGAIWAARLIGMVVIRRISGRGTWTWAWLVAPLIVVATAAVIQLDGPLVLRFRLSEPAMTRFAKRTLDKTSPGSPGRIGLYEVDRVETFDGGLRFTVAGTGFIDGAGFAYSPRGRPTDGPDNSYDHLDGPWYLWFWHF